MNCTRYRILERPPRGGLSVLAHSVSAHVRYWHKADMLIATRNVRYWGNSGHYPEIKNLIRRRN